jgi:hypothetical protein
MRHVLAAASSLLVVVACSSETEEACPIVGTYSVVGVSESGDCPDPANQTPTYTISAAQSGGYIVEIQGIRGACTAENTGTCKVQGKCDVSILDAKDPRLATGTFQYAWTFDSGGFRGTASIALPDADSLPGGCTGTVRQTATRR